LTQYFDFMSQRMTKTSSQAEPNPKENVHTIGTLSQERDDRTSFIEDYKENKFDEPYQKKEEEPGMILTKKKDVCFGKDKDTIPTK